MKARVLPMHSVTTLHLNKYEESLLIVTNTNDFYFLFFIGGLLETCTRELVYTTSYIRRLSHLLRLDSYEKNKKTPCRRPPLVLRPLILVWSSKWLISVAFTNLILTTAIMALR